MFGPIVELLVILLLAVVFVMLVAVSVVVCVGCALLLKFLLGKDKAWVMERMGWRKPRKRRSRRVRRE